MPTTVCEGIEFRSRTEAAWYLVLKDYGLKPVYEPETFEIATYHSQGDPARRSCWYMPDFAITLPENIWCPAMTQPRHHAKTIMVEIKAGVERESEDIAKACVLGYQIPTLIIVGWPITYSAVVIHERFKGHPFGYRVFFDDDSVGWEDQICLDASPDENWLDLWEEDILEFTPQSCPSVDSQAYQIARTSWNRTKWNPYSTQR